MTQRLALTALTLILLTLVGWAETPTEAYHVYSQALQKAKSINELFPYLTRERVDSIKANLKPGQDAMILQMIKAMTPTDVKVTGSTTKGTTATVLLKGTGAGFDGKSAPATGTITLKQEDNHWKVDKEDWKMGGSK